MLTRVAAGIRPTSKETGRIIVARCLGIGDPSSDVAFLFRVGNLPIPPQLLCGGEAGWDFLQSHMVSL